MPATTLIAYATRSGTTEEVAETIFGALCDEGMTCDLVRMRDAQLIDGFKLAVLGVPLYMGRLLKEFHEFLDENQSVLEKMPVWVFVLGPVENKPEQFDASRAQAVAQMSKHPWFQPMEVQVFGGCWDLSRMGFPMSLLRMLPAGKVPAMDARDWPTVLQWAEGIAARSNQTAEPLAGIR